MIAQRPEYQLAIINHETSPFIFFNNHPLIRLDIPQLTFKAAFIINTIRSVNALITNCNQHILLINYLST